MSYKNQIIKTQATTLNSNSIVWWIAAATIARTCKQTSILNKSIMSMSIPYFLRGNNSAVLNAPGK